MDVRPPGCRECGAEEDCDCVCPVKPSWKTVYDEQEVGAGVAEIRAGWGCPISDLLAAPPAGDAHPGDDDPAAFT